MSLKRAASLGSQVWTAENENVEKVKKFTTKEKFLIVVTNITVEPMLLLYLLPSSMSGIATQNLNLEKACRVNLKMNESICDGLASRNSSMYQSSDEAYVQKYVASMYAWKTVIQSLIPAVLLLFMGSWSDRHKRRKPCIIMPVVGEALSVLGLIVCTYFYYEIPIEFTILAEVIPTAFSGGWFAMFMGVFSYISGVSSVENRTIRIGALSTFMSISHLIGISVSGIVFVLLGFYGVFGIALGMYVTGIIYGIVVVKEKYQEESVSKKVPFLRDFFSVHHVKDTFKVALNKNTSNKRKRICLMLLLVMFVIGPIHGEFTISYLFVRFKFHWSEIDYSIFLTYSAVLHLVATVSSIWFFSNYLKLDDALLGVISSVSKITASFIFAFAPNSTVFYMGVLIEMFNSTTFIAMRSITSKLVAEHELGKINALFGLSEALMPLVYGPIYSFLYKWMINTLPGAFYLFGGIFTIPATSIFFWMYLQHKKDAKELEELEERTQKEKLLKTEKNKQIVIVA